ncbi:DUF4184 family protein [Streptomyces sp. LaPpAH-108]|uniref:DUF4184 family protein n=1 Tax=Streptomyces sp. LaPpAH-108 TaxID=1155714 RepID=UPI00037D759B|nr:DUF4184 family protein [Streptomyces sp. LaPpAH-108]
MPFTLSHAAAVLPAVRRDGSGRGPLVPSVLVAGSFAPDLTYFAASFVPGAMEFGTVTHSFAGVASVDVLIAWTLVALWLLVREPLVALLPRALQARPAALLRCGARRARVRPATALWWYVSAALGALTHVVWDAFTHHDRWGSDLFPALMRDAAGLPLYTWLQYGTSALAAGVLVVFLLRALRLTPASAAPLGVPMLSARDRALAATALVCCAVVAALQRMTLLWGRLDARLLDVVPTVCFGAGAGLVVGVVAYAVAVRVWRPAAGSSERARERVGSGARLGE